MFHFSGVLGALKHHVLEEMREAAAAAGLEAKADLIIDADGDDGRGTVRRDDHAQAVGERGVFDGNMKLLHFGSPPGVFERAIQLLELFARGS